MEVHLQLTPINYSNFFTHCTPWPGPD